MSNNIQLNINYNLTSQIKQFIMDQQEEAEKSDNVNQQSPSKNNGNVQFNKLNLTENKNNDIQGDSNSIVLKEMMPTNKSSSQIKKRQSNSSINQALTYNLYQQNSNNMQQNKNSSQNDIDLNADDEESPIHKKRRGNVQSLDYVEKPRFLNKNNSVDDNRSSPENSVGDSEEHNEEADHHPDQIGNDSDMFDTESSGSNRQDVELGGITMAGEEVEIVKEEPDIEEEVDKPIQAMGGTLIYDAYSRMQGCEKIEKYFEENPYKKIQTDILFTKQEIKDTVKELFGGIARERDFLDEKDKFFFKNLPRFHQQRDYFNLKNTLQVPNQQNVLIFDSRFENGNLRKVAKVSNVEYNLWLENDLNTKGNTQWYYFKVTYKDIALHQDRKVQRIKFNMLNLAKTSSLYVLGMKPCIWSKNKNEKDGTGWFRGGENISYVQNEIPRYDNQVQPPSQIRGNTFLLNNNGAGEGVDYYYTFSFTYEFQANVDDEVWFAHAIPYTYTNMQEDLAEMRANDKYKSYLKMNILSPSLAKLPVPLLTITNNVDTYLDYYEEMRLMHQIPNIVKKAYRQKFQKAKKLKRQENDSKGRVKRLLEAAFEEEIKCFFEYNEDHFLTTSPSFAGFGGRLIKYIKDHGEKKAIIISCRVHPGEPQSSHMLNGLIEFLLSKEGDQLRKHFVIRIVPMLNPDGVVYGNYRCSLLGCDLNRKWDRPNRLLHPVIYNTKFMIRQMVGDRKVSLFCDLHGHSRKQNAFFYGCSYKNYEQEGRIKNAQLRIIPLLCCQRNNFFSLKDSRFNMERCKESTARVVVFKELNVMNSFTLECSFFGRECVVQTDSNRGGINKNGKKKKYIQMSQNDMNNLGMSLIQVMKNYQPGEQQKLQFISGKILDVFYDEFIKFIPPYILKREEEKRKKLEIELQGGGNKKGNSKKQKFQTSKTVEKPVQSFDISNNRQRSAMKEEYNLINKQADRSAARKANVGQEESSDQKLLGLSGKDCSESDHFNFPHNANDFLEFESFMNGIKNTMKEKDLKKKQKLEQLLEDMNKNGKKIDKVKVDLIVSDSESSGQSSGDEIKEKKKLKQIKKQKWIEKFIKKQEEQTKKEAKRKEEKDKSAAANHQTISKPVKRKKTIKEVKKPSIASQIQTEAVPSNITTNKASIIGDEIPKMDSQSFNQMTPGLIMGKQILVIKHQNDLQALSNIRNSDGGTTTSKGLTPSYRFPVSHIYNSREHHRVGSETGSNFNQEIPVKDLNSYELLPQTIEKSQLSLGRSYRSGNMTKNMKNIVVRENTMPQDSSFWKIDNNFMKARNQQQNQHLQILQNSRGSSSMLMAHDLDNKNTNTSQQSISRNHRLDEKSGSTNLMPKKELLVPQQSTSMKNRNCNNSDTKSKDEEREMPQIIQGSKLYHYNEDQRQQSVTVHQSIQSPKKSKNIIPSGIFVLNNSTEGNVFDEPEYQAKTFDQQRLQPVHRMKSSSHLSGIGVLKNQNSNKKEGLFNQQIIGVGQLDVPKSNGGNITKIQNYTNQPLQFGNQTLVQAISMKQQQRQTEQEFIAATQQRQNEHKNDFLIMGKNNHQIQSHSRQSHQKSPMKNRPFDNKPNSHWITNNPYQQDDSLNVGGKSIQDHFNSPKPKINNNMRNSIEQLSAPGKIKVLKTQNDNKMPQSSIQSQASMKMYSYGIGQSNPVQEAIRQEQNKQNIMKDLMKQISLDKKNRQNQQQMKQNPKQQQQQVYQQIIDQQYNNEIQEQQRAMLIQFISQHYSAQNINAAKIYEQNNINAAKIQEKNSEKYSLSPNVRRKYKLKQESGKVSQGDIETYYQRRGGSDLFESPHVIRNQQRGGHISIYNDNQKQSDIIAAAYMMNGFQDIDQIDRQIQIQTQTQQENGTKTSVRNNQQKNGGSNKTTARKRGKTSQAHTKR